MVKTVKLTVLLVCVSVLAGCSIEGTWKTVSVEPAEYADKFTLSTVTFGDDGAYTGTTSYEGKESTTTGQYDWNGLRLKITPADGAPREYQGMLWWGTKLCLHHEYKGRKMKGIMEKQDE